MPVTFSPAPHNQIESFRGGQCSTSAALLDTVLASTDKRVAPRHLQSSFGRDGAQPISISPQRNGLVDTVLAAYSHHHALTIRPDDVWLAILAQFSLFVNGASRAEQLRHLFVAHEGKQTVRAAMDGGMATADYGLAARSMTKALHEHVVDAGLRDWCLPRFSTTTPTDTVVASVLMMATLKSYFRYEFSTRCGLPRVTLLGEQDDWLDIFHRVDKLASYGAEAAAWRDLLKPVLARFVQAFEPGCAESEENVDFWQRVVHVGPNQSGGQRLSGWLTAFCAFDDKGAWVGPAQEDERPKCSKRKPHAPAAANVSHARALGEYALGSITRTQDAGLRIDGVRYHSIRLAKIPPAHAEVDLVIKDASGLRDAIMVAGLVGTASGDVETSSGSVSRGEVRPAPGWWICLAKDTSNK